MQIADLYGIAPPLGGDVATNFDMLKGLFFERWSKAGDNQVATDLMVIFGHAMLLAEGLLRPPRGRKSRFDWRHLVKQAAVGN